MSETLIVDAPVSLKQAADVAGLTWYTRAELEAMPAGPELDALVHEVVLPGSTAASGEPLPVSIQVGKAIVMIETHRAQGGIDNWDYDSPYLSRGDDGDAMHWVTIWPAMTFGFGETMALAICRAIVIDAWKLAVGIETCG